MDWTIVKEARERLDAEQGVVYKDWGGKNSIALIYPNSYTVGMSNLGFQCIYGLLNRDDKIVAERVFWEGHEPVSLESQRPLSDFDVLAFSLSYELDYFNAVHLLRSGGIPVLSFERDQHHPVVIAGGAAITANPQPLASIFDCFAVGEAEAILPHMLPVLIDGMESSRHKMLTNLARVPGVYVPGYNSGPVMRQYAKNFSEFATGSIVLTEYTELGDLYLMEIARGCVRGCRFCLAGYHFRPMRYRSVEMLLDQAKHGLQFRKRIGLVSAAISDHPQIDELVTGLRKMNADFSVSSVRVKPLSETLLKGLAESGTKSISLAPEAGSERLRQAISKGISKDDILSAVSKISEYEFGQVKLYFMIGLPSETEDDIVNIAELAQTARTIFDRNRSGTHLVLNVTPFVPKAGTPFQWYPMTASAVLKDRLALLKKQLRRTGIEVKSESIDWSIVQGMLSRGDVELGQVIANLPKVTLSQWRMAIEKAGIDAESVYRGIPVDAPLPWSVIDSGVSYELLKEEKEKSIRK